MYWIIQGLNEDGDQQPIPQELLYLGYPTDRDKRGQTPLMLWINVRKGEPVPYELKYANW